MNKKLVIIISAVVLVVIVGVCVFLNKSNAITLSGQKIKIVFDSNGGEKIDEMVIKKGSKAILPIAEKEGYRFVGWYLENEKITSSVDLKKDVTLVAKWTTKFRVFFNTDRGSQLESLNIECGEPLPALGIPTKRGYKFKAWKQKNGKIVKEGDILSCRNVTLFAEWEKTK